MGLSIMASSGFVVLISLFCLISGNAQAADINTAYVGIELRLVGTEIYGDLLRTWPNQKSQSSDSVTTNAGISLSADLHQRVISGELAPNDALQIESELMMRHGSLYYLPSTQDELRDVVGFPKTQALSATDLQDLIPVHAQMSLGIGVQASAYLIEKLKVKITVSLNEAAAQALTNMPPNVLPNTLPNPVVNTAPNSSPTPVPSASPKNSPASMTESAPESAPEILPESQKLPISPEPVSADQIQS